MISANLPAMETLSSDGVFSPDVKLVWLFIENFCAKSRLKDVIKFSSADGAGVVGAVVVVAVTEALVAASGWVTVKSLGNGLLLNCSE